jgi:hypothetical protein
MVQMKWNKMIKDENGEEHITMEQWEKDAEDESREHGRKKMRRDTLKCIKGKTLSEAKELVFLIKHKMPLNRKLN